MTPRRYRPSPLRAVPAFALVALLAACTGTTTTTTPPATQAGPSGSLGPRPSSPAVVKILQPTPNQVVTGTTVHIVMSLTGATIVQQTTTDIRPDQGHVHLYVNGTLVSMNYGLEQDIPVQPGTIQLKAEFVAADHAPFNPRVYSQEVIFTVTK